MITEEMKNNEQLSSLLEKYEELSQQAADGIVAVEKEQAEQEKEEEETSSNVSYNTYENARFGFSIQYPATFVKGPAPTNGDGRQLYFELRG